MEILQLWRSRAKILWASLSSVELRTAGGWMTKEVVEDAFTTVLLTLLENPQLMETVEDPIPWMRQAVIRQAIKAQRHYHPVDPDLVAGLMDDNWGQVEARFYLEQIFSLHLTRDQATAMRVHYLEDKKGVHSNVAYKSLRKLRWIYAPNHNGEAGRDLDASGGDSVS